MKCCQAAANCYANTTCRHCAMGMPTPSCDPGKTPSWDALYNCAGAKCNLECSVLSMCNPVTNEPCDTSMGQPCDLAAGFFDPIYTCLKPSSTPLCGTCDDTNGCAPTLHCLTDMMGKNGRCARYCCSDGDCGGGTCDTSNLPTGMVGLCMAALDAGVDPTCATDAGGPPAMSPSHGSCFVIPGMPSGDAGGG
jgi:hypothetical protein